MADRLRDEGIGISVDHAAIEARRRVKTAAELEGILRAQRAAEAGMAAGEALIRGAEHDGEHLRADGELLTAEAVRAAVRQACADAGAPAPPDIMVVSLLRRAAGTTPARGRSPPACRSRSTCGRATTRPAAGRT